MKCVWKINAEQSCHGSPKAFASMVLSCAVWYASVTVLLFDNVLILQLILLSIISFSKTLKCMFNKKLHAECLFLKEVNDNL